jgi:hypothetical protein
LSPEPRAPELHTPEPAPARTATPPTPPGADAQQAMQEIFSSTFGKQPFAQPLLSNPPSTTPPAAQGPSLGYMLVRLLLWPLFLLPKLFERRIAPAPAQTDQVSQAPPAQTGQAPQTALAPASQGSQVAPARGAWHTRRAGQIGLSVVGVLIALAGTADAYMIPEELPPVLFGLVTLSLLVVVLRWTWLLYLWGVINCLLLALMLVALIDASDYYDEQQVVAATAIALSVQILAIFFTIRGKRAQGR